MISRVLGKLFLSKMNYYFSKLVLGLKVELRKFYWLVAIQPKMTYSFRNFVESSLLYHAL